MPSQYPDYSPLKPVHSRTRSDLDADAEMEAFSRYVTVNESTSRPVTPLPEKVELTIIPRPPSRTGSMSDLSSSGIVSQQYLPELCRVTMIPSDQAERDSKGRLRVRVRKEEFQQYTRETRKWEWEETIGKEEKYEYKPAPLRNKSLRYTGPKPRGGGKVRERPKSAPPVDIYKRFEAYLQAEKYADETTTKGMKWKDKEFWFSRYGNGSGKVSISGLSDGLQECYVSQYKHSFVGEKIEKPHIARWMVEMEPKGVEHRKSKLCIMKHRHDHLAARPKSAPPDFLRARLVDDVDDSSDEVFMPIDRVETKQTVTTEIVETEMSWEEREQWRKKTNQRVRNESDVTQRLQELISGDDIDSYNEVDSSSYQASDDDSDNPRSPDSPLYLSKPRLIRICQEFPGIRTIERQQRRSSQKTRDSYVEEEEVPIEDEELKVRPKRPKPKKPKAKKPDYGFTFALTANNKINNGRSSSDAFQRY